MKHWTHPAHGNIRSQTLTPRGPALSNRRIDQLIREGHYGPRLQLIQEYKDSRKKVAPKTTRKVFRILGADEL